MNSVYLHEVTRLMNLWSLRILPILLPLTFLFGKLCFVQPTLNSTETYINTIFLHQIVDYFCATIGFQSFLHYLLYHFWLCRLWMSIGT